MRFKKFYLIATTTLLIVMTPILIMTIITLGNNLKDRISNENTIASSQAGTSLQNSERPQSPCDLDVSSENVISSGSLRAMEHLSTSNPSIGKDSKMKSPALELGQKIRKRH